jgi:Flp pilus assembly protein TadG
MAKLRSIRCAYLSKLNAFAAIYRPFRSRIPAEGVALVSEFRSHLASSVDLLRRWRQDESGVAALQMAIVAMPFAMLLFGILTICIYFFTYFSMENAAWEAARAIRTGQVQMSTGAYAGKVTLQDRQNAFRAALCADAPTLQDCGNKVVVIVQSNNSFGGIVQPKCATNGVLMNQAGAGFDTGAASSVILVTVCYPWQFANKLPFLKFGNLNDGSLLMQYSVAFRTEPYQ